MSKFTDKYRGALGLDGSETEKRTAGQTAGKNKGSSGFTEKYRKALNLDKDPLVRNVRGMADALMQTAMEVARSPMREKHNAHVRAAQKRYAEYEALANFDLEEGQKEIAELESTRAEKARNRRQPDSTYPAGYSAMVQSPYAASQQAPNDYDPEVTELDRLISEKKQYLNQAKRVQEGITLSSVTGNADFQEHSGYVSSYTDNAWDKFWGKNYDATYEYINNQNGFRDEYKRYYLTYSRDNPWSDGESAFEEKGYDYLNDNEIAIYNYHYAKNGKEAAEKYLDSIQETLNHRKATGMFENMEDKTALEIAFGVAAGLDQFESGVKNLFNFEDDYIAQTAIQMASGMVREDLGDAGPKLPKWMGGASMGQVAYDATTTTANMAPSMLTSMASNILLPGSGAFVGNTMMFASSAGNAYQEALNLGYDKGQARAYSTLVGASEAGLQYLLGGIGSLGGTSKSVTKMLNGIDNGFARTALKLGGNMLSEGMEEGLQEVLTALFKQWTLKVDEDINWSEVAYSALLGALTAGVMEGPGTIAKGVNTYKTGKRLQENGITAQRLSEIGSTFAANTVAYQLAGRVDENTGAYTMGRLFNEIGATLTEQNVNEITQALVAKNMDEATAKRNAEVVAKIVEGATLNDEFANALNDDKLLAEAVRTAIIDSNATWFQRTKGYNEALMALAQEKTAPKTAEAEQSPPGQENATDTDMVDAKNETVSEAVPGSKVVSISSIRNGVATVKLEDGSEASVRDVDLDPDEGVRIETIAGIEGISSEDANFILGALKATPGASAQMDALGAKEAYKYGYYGFSQEHITKHGVFANSLSETQRQAIYETGRKARQTQVEKATPKATVAKNATTGKVHFDGDRSALTERQSASLTAMEKVAEVLGVQIHVFESKVGENGKRIGANGWYDPKDSSIHIDLHAGSRGEGTMLFTLAHELTHHIRKWSPAKFKTLADFLMQEYGKKGVNVDGMVREQMAKAKRNGRTISYDTAYEEVVADSMETMLSDGKVMEKLAKLKTQDKALWQKIKDFIADMVSKIRSVYEGLAPDSVEGRYVAEMVDSIEKLQELFTEGLAEASENYQSLMTMEENTDVVPVEDVTKYSYRSLAEAAGFEAVENADGTRAFTRNGTKVSKVTVEDIENSPIGAMINFSLEKKDISKADADRQKKMFADICTLACKTNDFSMTMQFVGSAVFTGMKANADKQYGTTYDFPSICTKTQAVIDAMSRRMVDLGRGLNSDELVKLYQDVFASGNPVPCPECYVFSRWIGIGGLLDNIKKYQDYYGDMPVEDVAKAYLTMREKVAAFAEEQGISFGKAKGALTSKLTKEYNKLTEKIEKAQNQGEKVKPSDLKRLAELEPMMNTVKGMTWLENVYFADSSLKKVNPRFRVPNEVLFDLNNGEAFATKYKEAWAFRATQGAGYGKAITPYAEARLGEGILVTNNTTNAIKGKARGSLDNYFLRQKGTLDKKSRDALERARLKQKIQAFIGGQRFQSTSDARYENASDYLLAALEMQAMHGMVQVYTKVDGAVPALAAWKYSINQSLMPLGGGLDADGNVKDTSVGGMNRDIAFRNREKYETAGTITIGVNDNHIRAMFQQWGRDFIIPYHASGGKADMVAAFRSIQEGQEKRGKMVRSTDYSRTQSDKVLSDEVLRWQGKTPAQIQRIHEVRAARIAILAGGKVNMDVVRSNRFLSELYDKIRVGEWKGVKLAKSKVESQIYPNEFWDQSVSYEDSGKITRDYLEYCDDLGFLHRFSGLVPSNGKLVPVNGYDQYGNRVQLTDLAYKYDENGQKTDRVEDFFWKVLTDRRMYDNEGKYLPQKVVTLNDTTADTVTTFAKGNYGRQYDKALSMETAAEIAGKKYSDRVTDKETLDFLNKQDTITTYKTMQIVDGKLYPPMAARTNGVYEDYSVLGAWEQATEHPELIRNGNKFKLDKGKGQGSIEAAYNPYMHSSNLVLNDQFSGAYTRDNLVTVECEVPVSELTSGYHAQYAKDSVGWHSWHTGTVAGAIRKAKGVERQVFLSRWIKPVRIVPDAEVAAMYKELLDGTDVAVPDNVVTPSLLKELKNAGVKIKESGRIKYSDRDTMEQSIGDIRSEIADINDELMFAEGDEYRRLRNRLIKLNHELDKLTAQERKATRKTSLKTVLDNLGKYRRSDLESLAEQLSDGAWDGYEDLGRDELEQGIREIIEEREYSPIEMQSLKYGVYVRPVSSSDDVRYSDRDTESVSNRSLLANALEGVAQNDIEKRKIEEYKGKISLIEAEEKKLSELNAQIKELSFAKGKRDTKKINDLRFEAQQASNRINTYDRQLLRLEASKPLQDVLTREKKMAYDRAKQKGDEALAAYRLKAEAKQSEILRDYRETRAALRRQESDTSVMEREFVRIAKAYEKLEAKSGNTIAKLEAKLKEEAKKHRDDQKTWEAEFKRLVREYEASGRSIAKLEEKIERQKQVAENRADNRKKSALREKIKSFKARLEGSLLTPTDRQYIPIDLINAMVEVCDLIDTDTELYHADGSINKAQERRNLTKEKLQNLKDEYEKLKTHSDPMYAGEFDEMVYTYLTELRDRYSGKTLKQMSLDDLTEMYEILRAIEETLQDARKLIGWGDAEGVYEAGDSIVAEQNAITQSRKKGKRNAAQKARDASLNLSLAPVRNVERMSGYNGDSPLLKLFKKFEQGIRKKNKFVMEAYKSFEKLTSGKEYEKAMYTEVGGKKYTDVNGRTFGISKMQMMQAILSYEREAANDLHHIEGSGFSFADLDMLRKGKLRDAISEEYSHRVTAAVGLVEEFAEALKGDKWCQDYMAAARKFFNGMAKDAINETSITLKHRIIAKDKSYIPFEVDKNFVVREISAENDIQQTINSYGMLKGTKKGASQPLIITGLNNILDRHIDQVGNVYGLAIEVRNFNKVWNVKSRDAVGNDPTVKAAIQRNWGIEGVKHIEQAVQDIQGRRANEQSALYKKVKSNYIGATFLLNLSVVTKQIGSLYSATSMLRWRSPVRMVGNLLYTMANHKKISAEVDKYTATAWMRRQGLSDAELHTFMTEGKKTLPGKLVGKLPAVIHPGKWITAMDSAVALSLWKYAKIDTAKRTKLEGEELLKAAAEFYDEVVENTQSMTDVLHRPEIQKRSDIISESLGMFKTDLYQMAGQLHVTAGRFAANKSKENGKALCRTVYAIAMSAMWGQLMTTVFALLRYKVNQYRDEEDEELTVESWMKRQGFSFAGDLMGYIFPVFGSETVGFFENIMYGESEEIVDSLALTAINDLYDCMITVGSAAKEGEMPDPGDMKKLTIKALQTLGVPSNNIIRTYEAITLHSKDIANGEFLSFEAGVERSPKHHIHRIVEAMDAGNTDMAIGLYEEALEETVMDKSEDGSYDSDDLKEASSSLQSALGTKYKDGEVSEETARLILSEVFGKDDDDIYWILDKWTHAKENGSGEDWSKYEEFFSAVQTGKNLKTVIKKYTDNGVELKTLKSQITEHFKPLYKEMTSSERASIKGYLLNAFEQCGMEREKAETTIAEWRYEADYPEMSERITYTQYKRWNADGKPNGVSLELFTDVAEFRDDGTSSGSKSQDEVAEYIDSLPISTAQKDALWCCFWKETTLKNAPWH